MTNTAVQNAGIYYVNGLQVSWTNATTLSVATGHCRNTTNVNDIFLNNTVTINTGVNGAGGLDVGTLQDNTFYYVYAIGSSVAQAPGSAILSAVAPSSFSNFPQYYDMFHLLASGILTNGSAQILQFARAGNGLTRQHYYDVPISVLSAGAATSYTNINLASAVPIGNTVVHLQGQLTPNTAGDELYLRVNGSNATNGNTTVFGNVASQVSANNIDLMCDSSELIQYKVTSSSDSATVLVRGYLDVL